MAATPHHVALAEQYIDHVLAGRISVCQQVRQACQRQRDDLARQGSEDFPFLFDHGKAERICKFISNLTHTKGQWAGQKITLEPWQCSILTTLFGWVHRETNFRRFREAMIMLPRKSGKSIISAGIGLYMLTADGEAGAEVYCGATTERQALEVFTPAKLMVQNNPALRSHFGLTINAKSLVRLADNSRFVPVVRRPGDGSSPSCAIADEAHEHQTSDLIDTMVTGMAARQQPLMLVISTAGVNLEGPCFAMVLSGRKLLCGAERHDSRFYIEYTIDLDTDWTTDAALWMANPGMGISVGIDFLRDQQARAIRSPRDQAIFKTKHLGVFVTSGNAFFNMASWSACHRPELDPDDLAGEPCFIGLDLASKQDIAAMQLLFPRPDGTYVTLGRYYLPEDAAADPSRDNYHHWGEAGRLILTPGSMISQAQIADDLDEMRRLYDVREVVFDPFDSSWMTAKLMEEGVEVYTMQQTAANLSEPMKLVSGLLDEGKLLHPDAPLDPMSWMMSNVIARIDAKDRVFPRKEAAANKIDGPVALIMAMARAMLMQDEESGSLVAWI